MCDFVPEGEAGAIDPTFSHLSLCDANEHLICVPEQIFGVSLQDSDESLHRAVASAVRRLQRMHHPDRPGGSLYISR